MWTILADPTRRAVLDRLRLAPCDVAELGRSLQLTQPNTSKHLRVLRDAGLVRVTPDAQRRVYAVSPEPLAELEAWLAPYRELWSASLDALGRHLDAKEKS
jgi:DNA-binding transcriptional ArsR family regulator